VAKVQVLHADGTPVAGRVRLVLKQGKRELRQVVTLNLRGKGKHAFTDVVPGTYVVLAEFRGGTGAKKSKDRMVVKFQ
jgi:hypothetical protein